jgi:dienelactone hydrolase
VGQWYADFTQTTDAEVRDLLRPRQPSASTVRMRAGDIELDGTLSLPAAPRGIVVFAHGSGSSRHSPRNRHVAERLRDAGLATLLVDLLTSEEAAVDERTRELRFDIGLLAGRLVALSESLARHPSTARLRIGLFGASTGGGAALLAAARRPERVAAVVSRGGRPDLAGNALHDVRAPTLLLVGGRDDVVLELNRRALAAMHGNHRLHVVPGATHLFEEPGALDEVADLAAAWFNAHLPVASRSRH